jgi:hypothetical protein
MAYQRIFMFKSDSDTLGERITAYQNRRGFRDQQAALEALIRIGLLAEVCPPGSIITRNAETQMTGFSQPKTGWHLNDDGTQHENEEIQF